MNRISSSFLIVMTLVVGCGDKETPPSAHTPSSPSSATPAAASPPAARALTAMERGAPDDGPLRPSATPRVGVLTLAADFAPIERNVMSGGRASLGDRATDNLCRGFVNAEPDFKFVLSANPPEGKAVRVSFANTADAIEASLVVWRTHDEPNGHFLCTRQGDFVGEDVMNVALDQAGTYYVWLGSHSPEDAVQGRFRVEMGEGES